MFMKFVTEEAEENEHWSKKLWRILNEGNFSAIEIGVTLFTIISVIITTVVIVIRCKKKYKRPALPPIPRSNFFINQGQQEQNVFFKSDTLYEVINDSSKSSQAIKENVISLCPNTNLLHVAKTTITKTITSSNSSNNEYSKDPTSYLTSSGTSNDDSQNPTPYFPDRPVFEFDEGHPNAFVVEALKKVDVSHECPCKTLEKYKALTLDRPRRKKRRSKQKSLDFHLSKTQADICHFYMPMTANKSLSIDELLHKAVKSNECLSEYISHNIEVPVIVITTPEQDRDLYLLKK